MGDVIAHALTRTVTETDNVLMTTLTLNPARLHLDHHYAAEETEFGRPLVNSMFTLALLVGMSVLETTHGTTVANLGFEEVTFPAPVFCGDTMHAEIGGRGRTGVGLAARRRHRHLRAPRVQPGRRARVPSSAQRARCTAAPRSVVTGDAAALVTGTGRALPGRALTAFAGVLAGAGRRPRLVLGAARVVGRRIPVRSGPRCGSSPTSSGHTRRCPRASRRPTPSGSTRFFPDARLNVAETLAARSRPTSPRSLFAREDGVRRTVHARRAARAGVAASSRRCAPRGVRAGDRVAAWLPNAPETYALMLAAASLGAVFSSTSPDFGVDGVVDRFGQIEPTVLVRRRRLPLRRQAVRLPSTGSRRSAGGCRRSQR